MRKCAEVYEPKAHVLLVWNMLVRACNMYPDFKHQTQTHNSLTYLKHYCNMGVMAHLALNNLDQESAVTGTIGCFTTLNWLYMFVTLQWNKNIIIMKSPKSKGRAMYVWYWDLTIILCCSYYRSLLVVCSNFKFVVDIIQSMHTNYIRYTTI